MKPTPSANKRQILESLLEQGMVLIALDARVEGVVVPPHLYHDPQLRLNISYRFGLPMTLDQMGIQATLTFSGTSFQCEIPWSAIFLAVSHVSGEPYLFAEDIPSLQTMPDDFNHTAAAPDSVKQPPKLTLVTSSTELHEAEADEEDDDGLPIQDEPTPMRQSPQSIGNQQSVSAVDTEPNPPNSPPTRGHLRLVK